MTACVCGSGHTVGTVAGVAVCGPCAGAAARDSLRLVAEGSAPQAYLHEYGSAQDFVRDHLFPAFVRFHRSAYGRMRCMAFDDGEPCFKTTTDSLVIGRTEDAPWIQRTEAWFCAPHLFQMRRWLVAAQSEDDLALADELSRGVVARWREALTAWDATGREGPNPLPRLTQEEFDLVRPYVGAVLTMRRRSHALDDYEGPRYASREARWVGWVVRDLPIEVRKNGSLSVTVEPGEVYETVRHAAEEVAAALGAMRGHEVRVSFDRADRRAERAEKDERVARDKGFRVYRCWAEDGTLLYVGQTAEGTARLRQHETGTPWWPEVASVSWERFSSREEMDEAERAAIRAESPVHNVRDKADLVRVAPPGEPPQVT